MEKRNMNYTTGFFQMDSDILKTFKLNERFQLEYRAEIFDLTNNQNFNTPVSATNKDVTAAAGTNFLNYALRDVTDGQNRTMRMGVKLKF